MYCEGWLARGIGPISHSCNTSEDSVAVLQKVVLLHSSNCRDSSYNRVCAGFKIEVDKDGRDDPR